MLELVMNVCLLANPSKCHDVSLIFAEVTPIQCQMGLAGQNEMATWHNTHPNWRIAKWRCQEAGKFAKL